MPKDRTFDPSRALAALALFGAVVAAWALERPPRPPAGPVPQRPAEASPAGWAFWRKAVAATVAAAGRDRLLAVAAGVVFYALLALFPAITAFVSLYGLMFDPASIQDHVGRLGALMPGGGVEIVSAQIERISAQSSRLGIGFAAGLAVALWSANAGVKAMIDALNVIDGRSERRGFLRLNAISLALTLGAILFLLLAVGAVVAFPLAMSAFGLGDAVDPGAWMVRWPGLFVMALLALSVLYRFGPNLDGPRPPWITPGAAAAAVAWIAGSAALSLYLSSFADYNATYGSLGAAIGLMMWMWLSSIAVLLGAEFNSQVARLRRGA